MFPIGHLTKSQVRAIARDNGLHEIANKKEVIIIVNKINISMYCLVYILEYGVMLYW